ncbi:hypothetical protein Gohar_027692, partial [Gossypium harknessii]|nr:hypothetical protein [Gossypium harknessii]
MEQSLPKQPQGVIIAIDVVDEGTEQQEGNLTGNEEQEDSSRHGSSSSLELDLESGVVSEAKSHLAKELERDCRICHLTLDPTNHESGVPIKLGCSCKDDLAAAHKHCAEAWFKIKGN